MRPLLVALTAVVFSVQAFGATPPPPNAQQQAAINACRAQGLAPPSDAFNQCIAKQLGGPSAPPGAAPPAPTAAFNACQSQGLKVGSDAFNACVKAYDANAAKKPSAPPSAAQQGAIAACKAKGFVENTPDYQECLKGTTVSGGTAEQQAWENACAASGIARRTDAFKACVTAASAAASIAGWNGEQLAAYDACKSAGNAFPSAAFAACLSKVLTKLIPSTAKAAAKDAQATILACQAKRLLGAALQQCVKDGLGS